MLKRPCLQGVVYKCLKCKTRQTFSAAKLPNFIDGKSSRKLPSPEIFGRERLKIGIIMTLKQHFHVMTVAYTFF